MVTEQLRRMFESRGIALVPVDTGVRMFVEQFAPERGHDVVTVIGPTTPLSQRRTDAAPTGAIVERGIAALGDEAILGDHQIGGQTVLPTSVALGWCVNLLERLHPDRVVIGGRDFHVHKGIVFDGSERGRFQFEALPQNGGGTVAAAIRAVPETGLPRPHYAATLILADGPQPAPRLDGIAQLLAGDSEPGRPLYDDGTLFHGPALQGISRILAASPERLVVECKLPDSRLADAAFDGQLYAPCSATCCCRPRSCGPAASPTRPACRWGSAGSSCSSGCPAMSRSS